MIQGLYPLLDTDRLGWTTPQALASHTPDLLAYAEAAASAGATVLQLRAKSLPLGHPLRVDLVGRLLDPIAGRLLLVVDDDWQALLPFAERWGVGLHLGQDDLPVSEARARLGDQVVIGWSTHVAEQIALSADLQVDYVGFGPIRATSSKAAPDPVTGVAALAAAVAACRHPVVAIGGLEAEDLPAVRAAGATAAAVIGAWLGPAGRPHPPAQAGKALAALVRAWQGGAPQAEAAHGRDGDEHGR